MDNVEQFTDEINNSLNENELLFVAGGSSADQCIHITQEDKQYLRENYSVVSKE